MNWPEAFERSSAHFANAYLWHDALTAAMFGGFMGVAIGVTVAVILHRVRASAP